MTGPPDHSSSDRRASDPVASTNPPSDGQRVSGRAKRVRATRNRRWYAWARLPWLRRGVGLLVFAAVVEFLVLPQIAGSRHALTLLTNLNPAWLLLGVVLEALSLVSYSLLTRSVLPAQRRPRFSWLLRTDLTSLGVSHVLPGGAATASTVRFRLLHEGGVSSEDAVVGATVQGVGSALVLNALLWIAVALSIPIVGLQPLYLAAVAVGLVLAALAGASIAGVTRRPTRAVRIVRASIALLPARARSPVARALERAATQLNQLLANRRELRRSALWAGVNWLLDAAALWVFLAAYGWRGDPIGLVVGYGLANVLAVIPISPGGLGVIEGVLIPTFVGFGAPRGIAVLGVVSWRLFNFWAPIPVAGLCYASLQLQDSRDRGHLKRLRADFTTLFQSPRDASAPASVIDEDHHKP